MVIAWIIGFAIYFRKRYNRKLRNRAIAAGEAEPRPKDLEQPKEKVIIPPDPAVLLGQRQPGEHVFPERSKSHHSSEGKIHRMIYANGRGKSIDGYAHQPGESRELLPSQPPLIRSNSADNLIQEITTVPIQR